VEISGVSVSRRTWTGGRAIAAPTNVTKAPGLSFALIHLSAWNRNSANFALWAFSELRVDGALRSWLRGSADGIMLVVEGEIPRWLKRESPVVDLIEERSPGELS
jgi:hypothetical protein